MLHPDHVEATLRRVAERGKGRKPVLDIALRLARETPEAVFHRVFRDLPTDDPARMLVLHRPLTPDVMRSMEGLRDRGQARWVYASDAALFEFSPRSEWGGHGWLLNAAVAWYPARETRFSALPTRPEERVGGPQMFTGIHRHWALVTLVLPKSLEGEVWSLLPDDVREGLEETFPMLRGLPIPLMDLRDVLERWLPLRVFLNAHRTYPGAGRPLALLDGTYTMWGARRPPQGLGAEDEGPETTRWGQEVKDQVGRVLDDMFREHMDVVGVVSMPRSRMLGETLYRVGRWQGVDEPRILGLPDGLLFYHLLPDGFATPPIPVRDIHTPLPPYRSFVSYMRVQTEILRLEFPAWMVEQEAWVAAAVEVYAQARASRHGYPLLLKRAHETTQVPAEQRRRIAQALSRLDLMVPSGKMRAKQGT